MNELEALREMQDYWKTEMQEKEKEFERELNDIRMATAAVPGHVSVAADGSLVTVSDGTGVSPVSIDTLMKLADPNLLQAVETSDMDQSISILDENEFKRISKERLATKLREGVAKKAKYTMLKKPHEHTVVTRARVYVFSEEEMRLFIEKLMNYRK
jgi:hypothetical protein